MGWSGGVFVTVWQSENKKADLASVLLSVTGGAMRGPLLFGAILSGRGCGLCVLPWL